MQFYCLPVESAYCVAIKWQLLFLNQGKRKNGHRNAFRTKSSQKNVQEEKGIDLSVAYILNCFTVDRATMPGSFKSNKGLFFFTSN